MSTVDSILSNCVVSARSDLDLTMSEFVQTFEDHVGFTEIASTIVRLLMTHIDLPSTHDDSPVHNYGCDTSSDVIMAHLYEDVANVSTHKSLLPAFFHPGGVYYPMLNSVMDEYWNYIDLITK